MATKKNFKSNPNELFFTPQEVVEEAAETNKEELIIERVIPPTVAEEPSDNFTVPKGYKLVQEAKSKRIQLLVRPVTFKGLKELSEERQESVNEIINRLIEDYLKGEGK